VRKHVASSAPGLSSTFLKAFTPSLQSSTASHFSNSRTLTRREDWRRRKLGQCSFPCRPLGNRKLPQVLEHSGMPNFTKKRRQIETGFSNLNRIKHRWRSRHDNIKYLDRLAWTLIYNLWKINKKHLEIAARKENIQSNLTFFQNQDYLNQSFLMMKKNYGG